MPGNAKAPDALLERRSDLREEFLELSVVQLTLFQKPSLSIDIPSARVAEARS